MANRRIDERRELNKELADRLDAIEEDYHARADRNQAAIRRWSIATIVILVLVVISTAAGGVANVYLLDQNGERADEIQHERVDAVRHNCVEQNRRHDNTIKVLDQQLAQLTLADVRKAAGPAKRKKIDAVITLSKWAHNDAEARAFLKQAERLVTKKQTEQIEQSRGANVFLIQALVPHRDCDRLVELSVPSESHA